MRINHNNEPATTLQMMHRLALVSAADGLRFLLCNCCFFFQFSPNWKVHPTYRSICSKWFPAKKCPDTNQLSKDIPGSFKRRGGLLMRGNCQYVCVCVWGGVTFEVCNSGAGLLCCGAGKSPYFTGHIFCHLEGEDSDSEQSFLRCTWI